MIVKIGDKYFDSLEQPILLILGDGEKSSLSNMGEQKKFCSFPEGSNIKEIKDFMNVPDKIMELVNYDDEIDYSEESGI
ncbi:hypothetical protein BSK59_13720 [Paenibacillus odorifer]|uniref:hypothetical protein n=1 Tax=Paenibacillus odorifer TaxID=189426 RepID=UPI00096CD90C|nr:hypothetical protein [Paenibacillus odorifer]OME55529.1 hypothetical protein BSK59_13720 [Paenibacillus odorifer]